MGIFNSARRALGSLRPLTDAELDQEREAARLRHASGEDLYDELRRYDDEMRRRSVRNSPQPGPTVHTEHGWYLSEDK